MFRQIKRLFPSREIEKKTLGRWNLIYDQGQLQKRIDLANEDHCGPCGTKGFERTPYSGVHSMRLCNSNAAKPPAT